MSASPAHSDVDQQVAQCQRLAKVLTMTQQMLQHADAGEWEQVTEMEATRRDELAACFERTTVVADSNLVAEALVALLNLNEELMSKLSAAKSVVLDSGVKASRGRSAVGSYADMQYGAV